MNKSKIFNILTALAVLVTSFAVYQPAEAKSPARFNLQDAEYVPDEVVVVFANSSEKNLVGKIQQAVQTAQRTDGQVTRMSQEGTAVIEVTTDLEDALADLNQQPGVRYAEPNYILSLPAEAATSGTGYILNSEFAMRPVTPSSATGGASIVAIPKDNIRAAATKGIYPTDLYLNDNAGWAWVGADIVWPNTTTSANVCVIDTGVDTAHPDLKGKLLAGYDFVNVDTSPLDDNGHGTHVTGILVAAQNNGQGIAGISTGKVVPVKALDAQGIGTSFDVSLAIAYCANRGDIRVINLSLGSLSSSNFIYDALLYATTPIGQIVPGVSVVNGIEGTDGYKDYPGKGKLVVAAAGNAGNNVPVYPAALSLEPEFENRILSVAASGRLDDPAGPVNTLYMNYHCRSEYSNYGAWVNILAPGSDIYSTTPYDKPFLKNTEEGINTRYDSMSGTSMAAAFVSGAAARRMGYKPAETSTQVGELLVDVTPGPPIGTPLIMSHPDDAGVACNDASMNGRIQVNVAKLLDRAAITASVYDAVAGTALYKATVSAYAGGKKYGSSVIPAISFVPLPGEDIDSKRVFTYYQPSADILNLSTLIVNYEVKVNMSGYTVGDQSVFQHYAPAALTSGEFKFFENGAVPPKSVNFDISLGWQVWQQGGFEAANGPFDLDLYLWLPSTSQQFVVGYSGDAFGFLEGDSYGTLSALPFARMKREGGYVDGGPLVETTTILARPSNKALPYYTGNYTIMVTDYGQTIDHDDDGCGDNYGYSYTSTPTPCGGTQGIALLGAYYTPYIYVWKDGAVKHFQDSSNNFAPWAAEVEPTETLATCNDHWWKAFNLSSPSTSAVYSPYTLGPGIPSCDDGLTAGFIPYVGYTNQPGDRIELLNK